MSTPVRTLSETPAVSAPLDSDAARWYKDAVIYELNVRAFQDSDFDGIGDFRKRGRKIRVRNFQPVHAHPFIDAHQMG